MNKKLVVKLISHYFFTLSLGIKTFRNYGDSNSHQICNLFSSFCYRCSRILQRLPFRYQIGPHTRIGAHKVRCSYGGVRRSDLQQRASALAAAVATSKVRRHNKMMNSAAMICFPASFKKGGLAILSSSTSLNPILKIFRINLWPLLPHLCISHSQVGLLQDGESIEQASNACAG